MVEHSYFDVHTDQWHTNGHAALQPAPEAAVPSARTLWREAVAQAAERARAALPEANGRIDCAVALVLQGDVELLADGTARVGSQSTPEQVYHVNGACQCQDFARAPHGGQCKHRIARGIAVRAQQRLEAALAELDAAAAPVVPQPVPAPAAGASLPEAPASANAFVVIDGHRVQITVRGHTLAGVLTEIRTVLAQFPAEGAKEAAALPEPDPTFCTIHDVWMKEQKNERGSWWSHKTEDGWCKGAKKGAKK
jgi:hypothetical protein